MKVLDLFSAAAGGWSLGLHRAGFQTLAACEWIAWRRALYAENNPGVLIYDDVRTLTGERLFADVGAFPDLVAGSPPCQDISSANTKGKGVDGERSGLYFEAIRIIGEVQRLGRKRGTGGARWVALENSSNLRTRGADRVLSSLESLGYTCWSFVVGGDDVGANHQRKRSWIIGVDLEQLTSDAQGVGCGARPGDHQGEHAGINGGFAGHDIDNGDAPDPDGVGRHGGRQGGRGGLDLSVPQNPGHAAEDGRRSGLSGRCAGADSGPEQPSRRDAVDASGLGYEGGGPRRHGPDGDGSAPVAGGDGSPRQMGLCAPDRDDAIRRRADWSLDDLARHLRLDDGLSARLAGTRVDIGDGKGQSAASLVVEAFGDAVLPQIPEAIGRAILRVEAAYAALRHPVNNTTPQPKEAANDGAALKQTGEAA